MLPHQLQQNSQELNSYVESLRQWESKKRAPKEQEEEKTEPIESEEPPALEKHQRASRIQASDYKSWEQYDVDKALAEADDKKDSQLLIKLSEKERVRGNEYFKAGDFSNAVKAYFRGLKAWPLSSTLMFNRAFALMKLHNYGDALVDLDAGLKLDGRNVKGLWRRAVCLRALCRAEEARLVLLNALDIEPGNQTIISELERLQSVLPGKVRQVSIEFIGKWKSRALVETPRVETAEVAAESNVQQAEIAAETKVSNPSDILTDTHDVKMPKNQIEFLRDWKVVVGRGESAVTAYLQSIQPVAFSTTLKRCIEPAHFNKILEIVVDGKLDNFEAYLDNLRKSERFSMNLMFASKEVRAKLTKMLEIRKADEALKKS
eukprot:Partr_v1_DN24003_c0_g1_i2_m34789 putative RNA polymerase II associated protein 3